MYSSFRNVLGPEVLRCTDVTDLVKIYCTIVSLVYHILLCGFNIDLGQKYIVPLGLKRNIPGPGHQIIEYAPGPLSQKSLDLSVHRTPWSTLFGLRGFQLCNVLHMYYIALRAGPMAG